MKITTRQIAITGILLAICIVSQFFKNLSVFITGPIINACLIIAVLTAGLSCGIILSIITPVTAFIITGSPVMAAVPAMIPMVMLGNAVLVICVWLFYNKFLNNINKNIRLCIGMIGGSIIKAVVMGLTISLWLLPSFLPQPIKEKMLPVLQAQFSTVQLITALIGSVLAFAVWIPLKKYLNASDKIYKVI
ncbi:MAG: ECF transporter S component [Butyrivibrio sp.]|uniref:ECF transporter S component n=1 Tax=Butyrivibrio sp. TaxID=28121 RepID=UPI0025F9517D|nr:ECF transporter S component [Butyrivibrio sp.]MCR5771860.1 ECF transporter S component [Butyrivibrio sp.]